MKDKAKDICLTLSEMREEVVRKAVCRPAREGLYRAVLKASFVRIFEYIEYLNTSVTEDKAEGFFACAPLRQCCEDLIALTYLALLKRRDRDAVVVSLMMITTSVAIEKQGAFFHRNHPFQPVLTQMWPSDRLTGAKDKLTEIGARENSGTHRKSFLLLSRWHERSASRSCTSSYMQRHRKSCTLMFALHLGAAGETLRSRNLLFACQFLPLLLALCEDLRRISSDPIQQEISPNVSSLPRLHAFNRRNRAVA